MFKKTNSIPVSDQLSGGAFLLGREAPVEFLPGGLVHKIALGRSVHAGDAILIPGDQLLAVVLAP